MSKKLGVGKALVDFITMLGFEEKPTEADAKYYVNKAGKQIKLHQLKREVSFLDKYGKTLNISQEVSMEDIQKFSKS